MNVGPALAGSVACLLLAACASTPPMPQPSLAPGATASVPVNGPSFPTDLSEPQSACDVLFEAEVASVLGVDIDQAQEGAASADGAGWFSECYFLRRFDLVPLQVTLAAGEAYQGRFAEIATEPAVSPVDGVGDQALLMVSDVWGLDGPISSLFVRQGGALMGLALGITDITEEGTPLLPGGAGDQQRMLVELATLAIDRSTASPPPVSSRTCQLLSVEEAEGETGYGLASAEDVDEHDVWGPTCRYSNAGGDVKLFVGVSDQPAANAQFEECREDGDIVLGVGDEATVGGGCYPFISGAPISDMLLARSGQTVVAVGHSSLEMDGRDRLVAVGRLLLTKLGRDPGTTPRPILPALLTDPCRLLSATEVAEVIGAPITELVPRPDDYDRQESDCDYHAGDDGQFWPLTIHVDASARALDTWRQYTTYGRGNKVDVEGIGDGALSEQNDTYGADHPMVTVWVLSGNGMVRLAMGPVGLSDDFKYVAPGTPEEQLAMLRQLAGIMLPRLYDQ